MSQEKDSKKWCGYCNKNKSALPRHIRLLHNNIPFDSGILFNSTGVKHEPNPLSSGTNPVLNSDIDSNDLMDIKQTQANFTYNNSKEVPEQFFVNNPNDKMRYTDALRFQPNQQIKSHPNTVYF